MGGSDCKLLLLRESDNVNHGGKEKDNIRNEREERLVKTKELRDVILLLFNHRKS